MGKEEEMAGRRARRRRACRVTQAPPDLVTSPLASPRLRSGGRIPREAHSPWLEDRRSCRCPLAREDRSQVCASWRTPSFLENSRGLEVGWWVWEEEWSLSDPRELGGCGGGGGGKLGKERLRVSPYHREMDLLLFRVSRHILEGTGV
jgi:hypothetical protein